MASSITLSAGVRQNLLSLQDTASLLATTQNRLATGKKVNTALDNPTNFFTSKGLSNRASDLNALLDTIGQAQQTLKAADTGLTSLTSLVQSAKSIATQAQQATKGAVNYTNITGSVAIALDTTSSASVPATGSVATAGVASTQATSTLNSAGIGQLADLDTLVYTLGTGAAVTATFTTGSATLSTNTFHTAAELITTLNTGTGTSGNFGARATAAADGAGTGVTITSADVTSDFVVTGTHAGVTTNLTGTAHTLGDALTISDGTHTNSFYRVAAGASAANGTYSTAANLVTAIASSTNSIHSIITGTVISTTGITLTAANNVGITVSGATGALIGFGTAEVKNNVNSTLGALTGTLTVGVGSDPNNVLTFGTGNGQISTLTGLNAALAAFTDITGSTDSTRHINFAPTSSDNVTIGGTGSIVSALGLTAGTTTPTATVVSPNATRTNLQGQFNALLSQIDQLAKDSSYNGVNLLNGDNLKVTFNENGTSSLTISGVKFDSSGLGLSAVAGTGFQDNHNVDTTLTKLDTALTTLRSQASTFGSTLSTVQTRNDFTKNLVNVLQTGADNLVLADTNEEGANLLALQTRQSLSTTALSLANQSNQAVLKLLG
jgi:flagellin